MDKKRVKDARAQKAQIKLGRNDEILGMLKSGVLMIGNAWFGAMSLLLSCKTNLLNSIGGLTKKTNIVDLCKTL